MRSLTTPGIKRTIASLTPPNRSVGNSNSKALYGRVIRVVMSSDDPVWESYGRDQALYGVLYQKVSDTSSVEGEGIGFAYCDQANFRRIPIKGEFVLLENKFNAEAADDLAIQDASKVYWTDIIPIWNSPHLNPYPNQATDEANKPADTGPYFKENGEIKPLMLCPGDVSLEGRHGQSIRMGGSTSEESQKGISDRTGEPYIILRNGQPGLDKLDSDHKFRGSSGPVYAVLEDVNRDKSSIYLTSDHSVPLEEAFTKRNACKSNTPVLAKDYRGAQVLANADRIFLNARNNDIELSAKEGIGLEAKTIYIDGKEYVAFDADRIYLGKASVSASSNPSEDSKNNQPVLKGRTSTEWLDSLCTQLTTLLDALKSPAEGDSKVWISSVIAAASSLKPIVQTLQKNLSSLESKKVFTE